jgi:hypothetical protein
MQAVAYWPALEVELDSLLDDSVVAVTVPSAATEVEVASVVVAVVEASAEVLVEVVAVVVASTGGAAGVSWATEISGATPRAVTKAAAAIMRMEDFMCIAFSSWGGITGADAELYNIIQNRNADALRQ